MNKKDRDFYTVAEMAKILAVSLATVYRWMDEGLIKDYRVGSLRRVKKKNFDRFLKDSGMK